MYSFLKGGGVAGGVEALLSKDGSFFRRPLELRMGRGLAGGVLKVSSLEKLPRRPASGEAKERMDVTEKVFKYGCKYEH